MKIFAIKGPDNEQMIKKVYESLLEGYSRFGWSFKDEQNLRELKKKKFKDMGDSEKEAWKSAKFLLEAQKEDWVVHVNVPSWGQCVAARVEDEYDFDEGLYFDFHEFGWDFRHNLKVDPDSILVFNRNAPEVLPAISKRLKLQGRGWKIHAKEAWEQTIENLQTGETKLGEDTKGVYYLKKDVDSILDNLSAKVHEHHPRKKLEHFFASILPNVPNVEEAQVKGSGWGTDYGADVVATINEGLDIADLLEQKTLVVQVKSYEGMINDNEAIDQIKTAIQEYDADYGLIVTTAEPAKEFIDRVDKASKESFNEEGYGKGPEENNQAKISVLAGKDLAKFILKYGSEKLFET